MGKLAEAYVEIGSKTAGFDAGLSKTEKSLMESVSRMQSIAGAIGFGLGTAGMVGFLKNAADAASDLNETLSKVGVVFGDSAGTVTRMADEMAEKFGSVKTTTMDAAAMFGLIAQGAGLTSDRAAELSTKLVRLADDASSFYNVSLDVALEKIRAGLTGEAEPLRAFGVMLSETAVQQEAMKTKAAGASKELTDQEKVLARVELITRGLAKAQGDHARTMDGYANSVRKLSGEWENFKAEVGTPVANAGASGLASLFAGGAGLRAAAKEIPIGPGWLGTLGLTIASNFSSSARKALTEYMARGMAGDAMFDAIRDKDGRRMVDRVSRRGETGQEFQDRMMALALESAKKRRAEDFQAGRFQGGGFGAFGMFGDIGQRMNMGGLDAEIARRQQAMQRGAWSGGFGAMSSMDFARAAQESINRPQDETAKKQLDELVKIREAVSRPKDGPGGPVLRR